MNKIGRDKATSSRQKTEN